MENIFKNNTTAKINQKNSIDGLELLINLNNNSIKACFFDPQYRGVMDKLQYGNEGARQKGRAELNQMSEELIYSFIKEISRVLAKSGHLFLWVDKFHLCEGVKPWLKDTELQIVDLITWDKMRMGMGYRTRRQSEYLIIMQKLPIRAKDCWTIKNIRDVWSEKIENKSHPHQKPYTLQKTLISAVSQENDIILDPCSGSFEVLRACLEIGRNFIGTDIGQNN
jgi:site-specific DNA-methyltransferase (adenine-specific)